MSQTEDDVGNGVARVFGGCVFGLRALRPVALSASALSQLWHIDSVQGQF